MGPPDIFLVEAGVFGRSMVGRKKTKPPLLADYTPGRERITNSIKL
jgi:hypothetical protein